MARPIKYRDKKHAQHRSTVRNWRSTHSAGGRTYRKKRGTWKWLQKKS